MTHPRGQPIEYFDRYTSQIEAEPVYGERWLRWAYETAAGRLTTRAVASRAFFSRFYGWFMERPSSRSRIAPFIDQFDLDPDEFARTPGGFTSFNDFFRRHLKPGARPVDPDPRRLVFPADGRHLGIPDISRATGFYVKGQSFSLASFLGDESLAPRFDGGTMIISRLCPIDYHRFHFPAAGEPSTPATIGGPLFSVNPIALRRNIQYLTRNRRSLTRLETKSAGTVLNIAIGATNVGSIVQTFSPGAPVEKGDEHGFFQFGGSSVVTLFEPGAIRLADDLTAQSQEKRELYARMGDHMATLA